jgi:hypothetical protein
LSALRDARYLSLATFRKSGVAVETPVWFAESGDRLWVFSAGDAGKVKRLRNSSRSRVAPCDMRGGILGEWTESVARLVDDPEAIRAAHAAMRAKYGWQMSLGDFFATLSGRLQRRAWIEIEI